jgi:tRNA(Ile)-lysidine synthase
MPAIDNHFPGFAELVARSAGHAQSAQTLLHELAGIDLAVCRADPAGETIDVRRLAGLSGERADNLLRDWLFRRGVTMPSTARLAEIRAQMLHAEADMNPFFDFARHTLHRIDGRLALHPRLGQAPEDEVVLSWQPGQGEIPVPAWHGRLLVCIVEETDNAGDAGLPMALLAGARLTLRPREGRERLKPAANRPSKSLKSLFQEAGIASWERRWSPLLYAGEDLVFVAGLGMDARHFAPAGQGAVRLRWERR